MEEVWKDILTYDGSQYQVSNFGNVRKTKQVRILKGGVINIPNPITGRLTRKKVSHLVAENFLQMPNFSGYKDVRHIDGNTENNRADNLEWVSTNKVPNRKGPRPKMVNQYTKDGELIAVHNSIYEASLGTGIREQSIRAACSGRTKTCSGYVWKFADED